MNKCKALYVHAHMINMDVTLRIRVQNISYHTNVIVTVQLIITSTMLQIHSQSCLCMIYIIFYC